MLLIQLVGVALIVFIILRVLPGDPVAVILGPYRTDETVAAAEARLGLDKPMPIQYIIYMRNILTGDMGTSFMTGNPVMNDFASRVPATLELTTIAIILASLVALPMGIASAMVRGSAWDHTTRLLSLTGTAVPIFWLGLILIYFFFYLLEWFPPPLGRIGLEVMPPQKITGFLTVDSLLARDWDALVSSVRHLALPVLTLFWAPFGPILRVGRSTALETINADYVEFGRLMGLPRFRIWMYIGRGTLLPVLTMIGVLFSLALGGSVLVETMFSWPGVGDYATKAMLRSDYAPIQAFILLTATVTVFAQLVVDVLSGIIDPRVVYR